MKLAIAVAALVAVATASPAISPFIMKGREAHEHEFPYAVGIMLHYPQKPSWCSGTLISPNYVLTAAKCLTNLPDASVLTGAWNVNKAAQTIKVSRIISHPQFNPSTEENDIGILHLSTPANVSLPGVDIVRLPAKSQRNLSFNGEFTSSFGWGKSGRGGSTPHEILRTSNETIITNLSCLSSYPAYIHNSNICTGSDLGTPCDDDEGGALLLHDTDGKLTQVGVFSYQFSLGCTWGWPAVFTRVTSYLAWIEANSDVVLRN